MHFASQNEKSDKETWKKKRIFTVQIGKIEGRGHCTWSCLWAGSGHNTSSTSQAMFSLLGQRGKKPIMRHIQPWHDSWPISLQARSMACSRFTLMFAYHTPSIGKRRKIRIRKRWVWREVQAHKLPIDAEPFPNLSSSVETRHCPTLSHRWEWGAHSAQLRHLLDQHEI